MNDYVRGIPMVFSIPEEEVFSVAEFPFELIGSYVSVQDIPRYNFDLERKVKEDIVSFRDEMEVRTMHQMHQRRPMLVQRNQTGTISNNSSRSPRPPNMFKAKSTPLAALSGLGGSRTPMPSLSSIDTDDQPSPTIVHFNTSAMSDTNQLPMGRPKATSDVHEIDPSTIRSRLPALKKREEPKPMGTRIKGLFRSKSRTPQKA
ncbi:hypothetical protein IW140_005633 [Coemansia sp. RSA 1813]|nr:hypothetical protein EV178_003891 [Coemansia sp. RSA 1646]KAJ1770437.1 hypothetical protein LPJ74_003172 [Coemansia sp. RSA 1843]KAJ2086517.1 hypothetical protein IW138_005637 [Coemansia sp. RSA 986]KAJ2212566.1 hypothetical protein EV179_004548 [Coemansia sp. RSA 487]KAJ2564718.1 hypothetical protein IW140_005633 [Coemansia sp. RSA 1813]